MWIVSLSVSCLTGRRAVIRRLLSIALYSRLTVCIPLSILPTLHTFTGLAIAGLTAGSRLTSVDAHTIPGLFAGILHQQISLPQTVTIYFDPPAF